MLTTSPCTRVLCTCGRIVLSIALTMCLGLASQAQNNAVNFTTSQSIPLPDINNGTFDPNHADAVPVYVGCSNVFAGKFHSSSKMDFMGMCQPNEQDAQPFNAALLNQGNGLFNSVEDTAADTAFEVVALTADLNGDGFDDLILKVSSTATTEGHGGIGVQLSNGNGTFKAPVYYGAGAGAFPVAVGDFEDNGRIDIAAVTSGNKLTIFLNDGTGKFTQSAYSLSLTGLVGFFVAGDLNGDHKTDLALVSGSGTSTGTVTPFISEGNGKFTQGGTYKAGGGPISAVIGNFTSSAYGDIAITTSTGFNVLLGNSNGTFSSPIFTPYPTPISYNTGAHIVAADFDKDGKLDLALTTPVNVDIFWGAGTGAFSGPSVYSLPVGSDALVSADINDDGRQDLAVGGSDGSINILYNTGGRTFFAAPNTHASPSAGIVAGNFSGSGRKDIAVVNPPSCAAPCNGTVTILPNEGSYFGAGKTHTIGMHGQAIATGDINGDGVPDLVVTNATSGDSADTSILLGIKGGGFQPAHNITLGSLSNHAFLVDMNGDGKLDLVEDGGVALGDGKGDFGSLTPFPDGIGFGSLIAVADFNGDGHPDVVALFSDGQQADILINNGKGDFTATPFNAFDNDNVLNVFASGVAAGPLKPGGPNDIVVTGIATGDNVVFYNVVTYIFTNDGKGNFQLGNDMSVSVGPSANGGPVTIADFNRDGYPDIGFSAGDQFFISTGPNFNGPNLAYATTSGGAIVSGGATVFFNPYLAVADFNGDGWPDVAFNNAFDGVARLYNVPVPTVTPGSLSFTAGGTKKVTVKNTLSTSQSITAGLYTGASGSTSPFKISSNTCGTLKPGASCSISVEYSGSTQAGATLYISANGSFIAAVPVNSN